MSEGNDDNNWSRSEDGPRGDPLVVRGSETRLSKRTARQGQSPGKDGYNTVLLYLPRIRSLCFIFFIYLFSF